MSRRSSSRDNTSKTLLGRASEAIQAKLAAQALAFWTVVWIAVTSSTPCLAIVFNGVDYPVPLDGTNDAQPGLRAYFRAVAAAPGTKSVTLPTGRYFIGLTSSSNQIALPSNTTIDASRAQFVFPRHLPNTNQSYPFPLAFASSDVTNIYWTGGSLAGYGFNYTASDPATNLWQPKETPGFLYFTSTTNHGCEGITIANLYATNFSGPVVSIRGIGSGLDATASSFTSSRNLTLTNCQFINCGIYNWGYGYLLQIVSYSNHYSPAQWWMATNYMPKGALISPVTTTAGSSLIGFSNPGLVTLNPGTNISTRYQCSFYGTIPASSPPLAVGYPYYVVATNANGVLVSTTPGGTPVVFTESSTDKLGFVPSIFNAGAASYHPDGQSWDALTGAFVFTDCNTVRVTGCTWSSQGDSCQFLRTANIVMTNNHVLQTVVGAIFLAPGCTNAWISNNLFDLGADGSHVITVEQCTNVTIVSNIFNGGGRGSFILNPRNVTIANNLFRTNTTKAYRDYSVGRIGPEYGGIWEQTRLFDIINDGTFVGSITITNNIFYTDTAVYFAHFSGFYNRVMVTDNTISGTRVDGSRSSTELTYNYPAAPPFGFIGILYSSTIDRNKGLDMNSDGRFCTVLPYPTNQLTIPHFLPVVWPNTGYYSNYSGYTVFAGKDSTANYTPSVVAINPTTLPISTLAMDVSNIYVAFSSVLASNTPVTVDWTARQAIRFGSDTNIEDYLGRLTADGVSMTFNDYQALYTMAGTFKYAPGWSHFIEIYPLYGAWPGVLEKLKFTGTEPRLRSPGDFGAGDYGPRGLTGNGLTKYLQTSVTPSSFGGGLVGGLSVFVNSTSALIPSPGSYLAGVNDNGNQFGLRWTGNGLSAIYGGSSVAAVLPVSPLPSPALYSISRSSSTSISLYTNGVLAASNGSRTGSAGSTRNISLFASVDGSNRPTNYFKGTLAFAFVDDGTLNAVDYGNLNSAINRWLAYIHALP